MVARLGTTHQEETVNMLTTPHSVQKLTVSGHQLPTQVSTHHKHTTCT